ncbi:MAG: hypothetical protein WCT22_01195 [Patescibacteria group bacterium]
MTVGGDNSIHINAPHTNISVQETYSIIAGNSLEIIGQYGWAAYRRKLETLSWEPFANTQVAEIQKLRRNTIPFFTQRERLDSRKIKDELYVYMQATARRFPKDAKNSFFAQPVTEADTKANKFIIQGKNKPPWGLNKTTRIYMAVSPEKLKDAYESLRADFETQGILGNIIFALNLEALDNPDIRTVDNNSLIAYVPDSDETILTKLCSAINRVKKQNPKVFLLEAEQEARVRANAASEFLVPLDNTTWFIEQEKQREDRSYHTTTFAEMRTSIYQGKQALTNGLPNMNQYGDTLNYYKSRGIGRIPSDSPVFSMTRRLAMPGLVAMV